MRRGVLIGAAMVTMAAGCPLDSSLDGDSYLLVVESARLTPTAANGMSWCPSPLETRVSVTVDGVSNETPVGTGLAPRFDSGLLDAPAADFSHGVNITLLGRCDGTPFTIGSLWVHPPVADIRAGTLFLVAVAPDALVRVHFEPSGLDLAGDDSGVPGGGLDDGSGDDDGDPGDASPPPDDCSDGSCVWLDPGDPPPDTMDPGDGGDPGDDGGWNDPGDDGGGDCGCDPGGGDDGGGDDGGGDDGGGDDGGGDGGGDGFAKLPIFWKLLPNPEPHTHH